MKPFHSIEPICSSRSSISKVEWHLINLLTKGLSSKGMKQLQKEQFLVGQSNQKNFFWIENEQASENKKVKSQSFKTTKFLRRSNPTKWISIQVLQRYRHFLCLQVISSSKKKDWRHPWSLIQTISFRSSTLTLTNVGFERKMCFSTSRVFPISNISWNF